MEALDKLQLIGQEVKEGHQRLTIWDEAQKIDNKAQYDNLLDFSSEIEFDERFDQETYLKDHNAIGGMFEGLHRIDRSKPENQRANTKVQR